jgi:tRNA U34 5-methylaminomethyl-2-thiouridine-forming methyltransferase MnmC
MTQNQEIISFDEHDLPFSHRFEDHYYSRNDGRAECDHVFIQGNDIPERWAENEQFVIGELGFGTGLNFLETWRQWQVLRKEGQHLTFVSVEGFPMDREAATKALARWPSLAPLSERLLSHWTDLFRPIAMDTQTTLHVHHGEASEMLLNFPKVDAWYLDGFAPAKNPDMWSAELMKLVGEKTKLAGTFASYTAAGWVRRNLEDAGFVVEKRRGFGTKRDMIAGHKQ